ncbi:hypothetical protein B0H16DRAFT_752438 [Mycena metata]|uniref:Uncharacterized protein n=1 Tax=Mycena metata TaxID=1033252 RepID=A0AAD7DXW5_9AGAR|nr:hypothetical protein B0H16DRAFT_752438 [Mycena metata]
MSCPYTFGDANTVAYGATRAALNAPMNQVAISADSKHAMTVFESGPRRARKPRIMVFAVGKTVLITADASPVMFRPHATGPSRASFVESKAGRGGGRLAAGARTGAGATRGTAGAAAEAGTGGPRRGAGAGAPRTGAGAMTGGAATATGAEAATIAGTETAATGTGAETVATGTGAGAWYTATGTGAGTGTAVRAGSARRVRTLRSSCAGSGECARFATSCWSRVSMRFMRVSSVLDGGAMGSLQAQRERGQVGARGQQEEEARRQEEGAQAAYSSAQ